RGLSGVGGWRRMTPALVAGIICSALTGALVWQLRPAPAPLPVTRFIVQLPADQQFTNTGRKTVAISPDGTKLVYVANSRLYLKAIDRPEATAILGTEAPGVGPSGVTNLSGVTSPMFSPINRLLFRS